MTETTLAIEIVDLAAGYKGTPVLSDVTVAIPPGSIVGVVGPNGAGKSTLFKALVGQLPILNGSVTVYGQPLGQRLTSVAYVPQREEIDWQFPVSVLDVVLMGCFGRLGWLRRPGQTERALAMRCLQRLDVAHLANIPIGELSGGQQQRIFLARALAQEPRVLVLDEPFAGVDAVTRQLAVAVLNELKDQGVLVLVSTHDLALASSQFDLLLLLNRRLVDFGPPRLVLTPSTLSATFGDQVLIYQQGEQTIAVTDHCCPGNGPHVGSDQ